MKKLITLFIFLFICSALFAQLQKPTSENVYGSHKVNRDKNGDLLAWYKPDVPGAAYAHVSKLASEFIKSGTPIDYRTGLPMYLVTCCFQGPHMNSQEKFDAGKTGEDWPHNPVCVYAGLTQSLVLDYRVFSGEQEYIDVVRGMLDYQLENGTTPSGWIWPNVPYASADPFEKEYHGGTKWEHDGLRADGLHGIEPDKVGEMGYAYLKFYQVTGESKYLEAALHCADALAKHVRDVTTSDSPFITTQSSKSPWPFRVNARTGIIHDDYSSSVTETLKLFEELLRTQEKINLKQEQAEAYKKAHQLAFDWLFSRNGPLVTYVWTNYFEDIPNDPERTNRNQVAPLETARYLLKNPDLSKEANLYVPALIHYVASAFGTEGMDAIKEQTWCFEPMGSHTARYASICALWYAKTGEVKYKDEAFRFFNFATYMTDENGVVRVGPNWPGSWFSDGYADYIKHFMEGMAAVREWAPQSNHVLTSSSTVQKIKYEPSKISFSTYDSEGSAIVKLNAIPKKVVVSGKALTQSKTNSENSWNWKPMQQGGVLTVNYNNGNEIEIDINPKQVSSR